MSQNLTRVPRSIPRCESFLVGVEGFEPSMLQGAPGLRPGRATSRPNTPDILAERARVERASPEGTPRFKRDRLATCRTSPSIHGGSGASRTRKPRRYVPLRTGWAYHMPNATVAVGAGLEPAHALRREPRLQRGAIPFRSSYRLRKTGSSIQNFRERTASNSSMQSWRRRSDSNGWCPSRALRVSSAAP